MPYRAPPFYSPPPCPTCGGKHRIRIDQCPGLQPGHFVDCPDCPKAPPKVVMTEMHIAEVF